MTLDHKNVNQNKSAYYICSYIALVSISKLELATYGYDKLTCNAASTNANDHKLTIGCSAWYLYTPHRNSILINYVGSQHKPLSLWSYNDVGMTFCQREHPICIISYIIISLTLVCQKDILPLAMQQIGLVMLL